MPIKKKKRGEKVSRFAGGLQMKIFSHKKAPAKLGVKEEKGEAFPRGSSTASIDKRGGGKKKKKKKKMF